MLMMYFSDETGVGLKDDDDDDFYFLEVASKITLDTELSSITHKTNIWKIKKITKEENILSTSTLFTTIRQTQGPTEHQKESSIAQTIPTIFKFNYPSPEPKPETVNYPSPEPKPETVELANQVDSYDLPEWVYYTIASAILGVLGCVCGLTTWYCKKKLRINLRNERRQRREQRRNRDRGSGDYEEVPLSNMSQLTGASVSIVGENVENK